MTYSKEYKAADKFKRKIMREIAAGKHLLKHGWDCDLPADIDTLESVKRWYDCFKENKLVIGGP